MERAAEEIKHREVSARQVEEELSVSILKLNEEVRCKLSPSPSVMLPSDVALYYSMCVCACA